MKKLIVAGFILAITGCGGGGSTESPIVANIQTTSSNIQSTIVAEGQYFVEQVDLLPDLRPYFTAMCGNETQVGDFLVVDLNGDKLNDIVLSLWCGIDPAFANTQYNGPVKNTLVIFKQKSDKTFYIANQEYFGKDIIPLSGAGGTGAIAAGDFNNDGKIDIALARHKEDGRIPITFLDGTSNFAAYPQVLMSTSTGFELQTIPYYIVNNTVSIVKNTNNVDEIVIGGTHFTYNNKVWSIKRGYNFISQTTVSFYKDGANYILSQLDDNNFGLMLSKLDVDGYKTLSRFSLGPIEYAKFLDPKAGQNGPQNQQLVKIKGEYWFWAGLGHSCYAGTNGNTSIFYVLVEGVRLKDYDPNKVYVYGVDIINHDYVGRVLKVVSEGNNITSVEWNSDVITYNKEISCLDVNNDLGIDYVVNRWLDNTNNPKGVSTNPFVYLKNVDTHTKVNDVKFPGASSLYHLQYSHFVDINNDGKPDLIYTPSGFKDKNYAGPVRIQVFYADKTLD